MGFFCVKRTCFSEPMKPHNLIVNNWLWLSLIDYWAFLNTKQTSTMDTSTEIKTNRKKNLAGANTTMTEASKQGSG